MKVRVTYHEHCGLGLSVEAETADDKATLAAIKAQGLEPRGSTYDETGVLALHFTGPAKDPPS